MGAAGAARTVSLGGVGNWSRRLLRPLVSLDTWAATGYLLLLFPLGWIWFALVVGGVSTGLGSLPLLIGLPILLLTLGLVRCGAWVERGLLRLTLGHDVRTPYRRSPARTWWPRLRTFLTDPATWKDLLYLTLCLPLGVLWSTLVVVVWSVPLALSTILLWYRIAPDGARLLEFGDRPLLLVDTPPEALTLTAVGLVLLLAAPHAVRAFAAAQTAIVRVLLGTSRAALTRRVITLESTRAQAVEAAAAERRRIERDLHDGAQQRLVALAMSLGMAREKLDRDPEAARVLLDEAHQESKRAIVELRDLARGIHPAILTDRGLDAALSALAGRSPVLVDVRVDLPGRLPETLESTAYFIVAETLTNVARHAGATRADVHVCLHGDLLVVEVWDDGRGGADPAAGTGLAGLVNRMAAVDGELTVTSPVGGPTVIRATVPVTVQAGGVTP